jgi:hypothetical protein
VLVEIFSGLAGNFTRFLFSPKSHCLVMKGVLYEGVSKIFRTDAA